MGLSGSWRRRPVSSRHPRGARVELDARQVVRRRGRIDVLQFERDGTLQEALPGRGRHLGAAGQDHETDDGLLAQRPQGDRPQLLRDLVEPVQDHRDPACPHQLGGFRRAALACEQRVGLLEPAASQSPTRWVLGSHPCKVNITGTGTNCRSVKVTCCLCSRAARTSNTAAPVLPDPGSPMITSRPDPRPP